MQIVSRLLSSRGKNESLLPALNFLRREIGGRWRGQGDGDAWLAGLFFWQHWLSMGQVTSYCNRSSLQHVWLPVFSHSHWSCYRFATHCSVGRHLTLAPGKCWLQREVDIWFFMITLLGQPAGWLCQQQPQSTMFSMAAALKTAVVGDFYASPRLS